MTKEEVKNILQKVVSWKHDNLRGLPAIEYIAEAVEIILKEPSRPAGLDEAAEEYHSVVCDDGDFDGHYKRYVIGAFRAGAQWMARQGQTEVLTVESPLLGPPMICCPVKEHKNGDKVIVQIRKNHD